MNASGSIYVNVEGKDTQMDAESCNERNPVACNSEVKVNVK